MIHTYLFSLIFFGTLSLIGGVPPKKELRLEHVGLTGNFLYRPVDQATCTWAEIRKPGRGPRKFIIRCTNPQERRYNCTYRGNPHDCRWYNKNQLRFYTGLAREAAENQLTACSRDSLEHERCPGFPFDKI